MTSVWPAFSQAVYRYRTQRDWSQARLAQEAGVGVQAVIKAESTARISMTTAAKIIGALGIQVKFR